MYILNQFNRVVHVATELIDFVNRHQIFACTADPIFAFLTMSTNSQLIGRGSNHARSLVNIKSLISTIRGITFCSNIHHLIGKFTLILPICSVFVETSEGSGQSCAHLNVARDETLVDLNRRNAPRADLDAQAV